MEKFDQGITHKNDLENGFVIVQYFVVKTQQDDMIENVSIVHVHYRWRLRWQW